MAVFWVKSKKCVLLQLSCYIEKQTIENKGLEVSERYSVKVVLYH